MKFNIYSLGCKVNTYECEAISNQLLDNGYELSESDTDADLIIVNTCTVTQTSDAKSRKILRSVRKKNPNAIIVAMGCYTQLNKEEANEYANIILGTTRRHEIPVLVNKYLQDKKQINIVDSFFKDHNFEDLKLHRLSKHTRGFIKIQDGCENFCAYCAIPYSRGPIRSRDPESVISEINALVDQGVKEVILSGINTGTYGYDLKTINLAGLIKKICEETTINRIRLSSIELMEITDELLDTMHKYSSRIANHFHIPLQAGCDNTLKRMNRKYLTLDYSKTVDKIRKMFPGVAITTDCLAGFVGETEEDFNDAINFIRKINYASMHIFPYSRRKNTKADLMEGHLNPSVIHERARKMIEVAKEMKHNYELENIGSIQSVLFEREKNGYYVGHSSNYLEVEVKSDIDLTNTIRDVKIIALENDLMKGELV